MEKVGDGIIMDEDLTEYRAMLNVESSPRDKVRRLRTFPLSIHAKKALLAAYNAKDSTTCSEQCQESCGRCKAGCSECCSSMELWSRHLIVIEGMFGAGVGSFFSLLRSLFVLNALLFLAFLIFLVIPQGINSSDSIKAQMLVNLANASSLALTCSNGYEEKLYNVSLSATIATKVLDFLSGTGWMEKTILFFGVYFPIEVNVGSIPYNFPLAYLLVLGFSFLASIILLLVFAGRSFRAAVVNEKSISGNRYCNSILAGWDYSLINEKNAGLKVNMLYNEVIGNIRDDDHYEEMKNMGKGRRCCLYTVRALINILILGLLGGAGYLIYFVQHQSSNYTAANTDPGSFIRLLMEYLPSITIALIGAILPIIFKILVRFEKYDSETEIVLTLVRFVFVKMFAIVILVISLYTVITCNPKDSCLVGTGDCQKIYCWETYVGQQFYKLAITQFLVFLVITLVVESFRALIVKKCHCKLSQIIGLPEFDIPKCVLDLVYVQIITWFGSLFSPMLTGIAAVIFFVLFYLKVYACHLCYKPSETPFKASRANFFFLIVLMFAFFLCIIPIGYCIVEMKTSKSCGPFRVYTNMYDVIPATINSWPSWAVTVFQLMGSAACIALVLIILFIIIYYYATLASTRLIITRHLQAQVNTESRNKQILFQQLIAAGITPVIKGRRNPGGKTESPKKAPASKSSPKNNGSNSNPPDSYMHDGWE